MKDIKIDRIDIIPVQIPLIEPFVISKGALTHARNTIIRIYIKEGIYGTGECCPYRTIHGETQEGTVAAAKIIAPNFIGRDPRNIHALVALMDRLIVGNASIKCAFDMALYDLVAKMVDLPLYAYLGGDKNKEIFTDMTVSLLEKEKMAAKAVQFVEDGFPVLKIKLGDKSADRDIQRIRAIREAIGEEIPLRIDANQGWNYQSASMALTGMADSNIQHCEEPIPAWNTRDQVVLCAESPIFIMADESVFNHNDAFQVLSERAADLINIKLGKSGGFCHAMKLASIAQGADVNCQVGSFSETRLGITALVHFALCWDNIIYYDLDSPLMLSEDPVEGGLSYGKNWQVTITDTPGHGADFDSKFLEKFDRITIKA